ncbi:hypothetical protein [Luteimicrobium subarcticum]|uniref:Uncharacterized protein n=1 Tax=Luteimicrobium subarcticum TaxID=620910 RepID=A0A2M8WQQ1_9MICO|nr:hypothetical protein [Luteimicrobium subarcticum]PJI93237.1 hypothetical protein CLV34_1802 [Luteimicrobium subarcticum]
MMHETTGSSDVDLTRARGVQRFRAAERAVGRIVGVWLTTAGQVRSLERALTLSQDRSSLDAEQDAAVQGFVRRLALLTPSDRDAVARLLPAVAARPSEPLRSGPYLASVQGATHRWYQADPGRSDAAREVEMLVGAAEPPCDRLAALLRVLGDEPLPADEGVLMQAWGVVDALATPVEPDAVMGLARAEGSLRAVTGDSTRPAALRRHEGRGDG